MYVSARDAMSAPHEWMYPHVMRIQGRAQIWSLPDQYLADVGPFELLFTTQGVHLRDRINLGLAWGRLSKGHL